MPQPHRWQYRNPLGSVDANRAMGTVAAPLLAGFALATIVLLLTTASVKIMPCYEWAITVFVLAAALFIFAVQFTFMGLLYAAAPAERLDWLPPGQEPDDEAYAIATKIQLMDLALQERYFSRAGRLYSLGVLCYTAGLELIIVPRNWDFPRGIALSFITVAFVLELIWFVSALLGRRVQWLLPGYASVTDDR
jgi:hypothetical protein